MTTPARLQLLRRKGFNLQAESLALNDLPAVSVARPGIFGNPTSCSAPYGCPHSGAFVAADWQDKDGNVSPYRCCVDAFRHYVETGLTGEPTRTGKMVFALESLAGYPDRERLIKALPTLRGKNLACWCKPQAKCHADVLLEIANRPVCKEVR